MQIIHTIDPGKLANNGGDLPPRRAARVVVFDDKKNVALIHTSTNGHYTLPGGGIEEGETEIDAAKRECLEEIGCEVEIVSEFGIVAEYRRYYKPMKQESYYFVGRVISHDKDRKLTQDEIEAGYGAPLWVSLEEALRLVSSNPKEYDKEVLVEDRDALILATLLK